MENFKLSFGRPQIKIKDLNLNEAGKRVAVAEYIVHKRRTNKCYSDLSSEAAVKTTSHSFIVLQFYAEHSTSSEVEEVSYYNKLTTNVFCIHDVKKNKATIYKYLPRKYCKKDPH